MPELLAKPARPWALRLLPPFPAIANRVIALVNEENVAAGQISDVIKLDPTFTAEILRVANSALFGASREVTTIPLAVSRLGLERVKATATMIALSSMIKGTLRVETMRKVWTHSLVTALLTEESARISRSAVDSAYTAGLLHNLGCLGIMAAYPDEYTRMLEVSQEHNFDLLQTERDLFEIDHCAAGAYLAQEWNLPDEIAAAIASHHDEPTPGDLTIYSLVQISWRLADVLGYAAFPPDREWTYDELIGRIPRAERSWLGGGIEGCKEELHARLSSLPL